jgi:hypothetical protein
MIHPLSSNFSGHSLQSGYSCLLFMTFYNSFLVNCLKRVRPCVIGYAFSSHSKKEQQSSKGRLNQTILKCRLKSKPDKKQYTTFRNTPPQDRIFLKTCYSMKASY